MYIAKVALDIMQSHKLTICNIRYSVITQVI